MVAAHFREIAAGDDAEFGRQRLEQHGDQIGEQHDPQQAVAVFRAGLDVGREIAGVHVGDRGDDRRAGKGEIGARPAVLAAQNGLRRQHRAVGERFGFRVHRPSKLKSFPALQKIRLDIKRKLGLVANSLQLQLIWNFPPSRRVVARLIDGRSGGTSTCTATCLTLTVALPRRWQALALDWPCA